MAGIATIDNPALRNRIAEHESAVRRLTRDRVKIQEAVVGHERRHGRGAAYRQLVDLLAYVDRRLSQERAELADAREMEVAR